MRAVLSKARMVVEAREIYQTFAPEVIANPYMPATGRVRPSNVTAARGDMSGIVYRYIDHDSDNA